jgi:hypothetical protein
MSTPRRAFGTELSVNRGLRKELTLETRAGIITARVCGESASAVARRFSVSRGAVQAIERWYVVT